MTTKNKSIAFVFLLSVINKNAPFAPLKPGTIQQTAGPESRSYYTIVNSAGCAGSCSFAMVETYFQTGNATCVATLSWEHQWRLICFTYLSVNSFIRELTYGIHTHTYVMNLHT